MSDFSEDLPRVLEVQRFAAAREHEVYLLQLQVNAFSDDPALVAVNLAIKFPQIARSPFAQYGLMHTGVPQIRALSAALQSPDTDGKWGLPALPRHLRRYDCAGRSKGAEGKSMVPSSL
jgi:hypothetical protein